LAPTLLLFPVHWFFPPFSNLQIFWQPPCNGRRHRPFLVFLAFPSQYTVVSFRSQRLRFTPLPCRVVDRLHLFFHCKNPRPGPVLNFYALRFSDSPHTRFFPSCFFSCAEEPFLLASSVPALWSSPFPTSLSEGCFLTSWNQIFFVPKRSLPVSGSVGLYSLHPHTVNISLGLFLSCLVFSKAGLYQFPILVIPFGYVANDPPNLEFFPTQNEWF